ncbi:unnamed protein product [Lepeophtheirus salmonis]|uniref:(salmon louse) hypothetical protein n=1 Tax=Lepeophtheirus salmonis TaxID=72036 RepID=A0A7R8CFF6_LEPSM|nr:unnamed protein product [Lepeophtheirus salmonis]CAF2801506.1 unnamed protein product [Lepeophtheirus salmonis]
MSTGGIEEIIEDEATKLVNYLKVNATDLDGVEPDVFDEDPFFKDPLDFFEDEPGCKVLLFQTLGRSNVRIMDLLLFIPNLIFFVYLMMGLNKGSASFSLARCILSIILGMVFSYSHALDELGWILLHYAVLELKFPDPSFHFKGMNLFGFGGSFFLFFSSILFLLFYAALLILPCLTPCHKYVWALPQREASTTTAHPYSFSISSKSWARSYSSTTLWDSAFSMLPSTCTLLYSFPSSTSPFLGDSSKRHNLLSYFHTRHRSMTKIVRPQEKWNYVSLNCLIIIRVWNINSCSEIVKNLNY